ncbi:MAG: zinc-ribbon domain-containing protein [Acidaminococcaceae bacterium]|nr:zinc-ribbon domain-containing protein [Acidaminococcaceae bacterium]
MRQSIKQIVHVLLITVLLLVTAVPGFAAAVRRVPSKNLVGQGFLALTLDAEGAEDFRYIGQESQYHIYKGRIKPGAKIKLVMQATLAKQSSLPLTGRTCTARMEVIAKKGGEVIKKNSFKSDNKSNVFINYTVPEGADTLEVNETFVLNNQSKEEKFNQKCTTKNKLILSVTDDSAAAAKTGSKTESGDKKTDVNIGKNSGSESEKKTAGGDAGKKRDGDKKSDTENNKTDAGDKDEGGMSHKTMMAGAVAAVAAIVGGYFFMKKRKEDQAITEAIARKEKLRQQAIRKQQEMQQNMQSRHDEIGHRESMVEEERMREHEQAQQQAMQREEEQQRLMQEQNVSLQNANTVAAAGAAGVMGSTQNNVTEHASESVPNNVPRFCESCGAPLKPGSKFCENCGAKV